MMYSSPYTVNPSYFQLSSLKSLCPHQLPLCALRISRGAMQHPVSVQTAPHLCQALPRWTAAAGDQRAR